jgi:signal transduction histidine kinase
MPDTLAHEMSNPLNVVNSSLDNLQKEIVATQDSKYMQRAMNGVNRLGTIMGNLTEAANLEEAIRAEQPEKFDLTSLVSSYIEGYKQSHGDRRFLLDIESSPLYINGVPDHIAQMLDKLLDNAVDFGDPGTPILVSIKREETMARLTVANDGPGIPQHLGARLFEPMVSVRHKNAKRSHLGLGLYIVRLIAEFHRGQVEAKSRYQDASGEDRGAMITVTMPLAED